MPCKPMSCQCGKFILPQRYLMSFLCFSSIVLLFNMRVALNLAINEMIPKKNISKTAENVCPERSLTKKSKSSSLDRQDWSEMEQSFVRAAFYMGYVPAHLPAGVCADMFGARLMLIISMSVSAVFTLVVPIIIKFSGGSLAVGISRIFVGIGQGIAMPAISSLLSKWVPKKERAFLGSFALSGSHVGSIIGSAGSGILIDMFDNSWQAPFYFHGASGVCFIAVLVVWAWTSPADSPFVIEPELSMLKAEMKPKVKRRVPVWAILKDRVVWAMTIGQFGHAWVFFTFNTDLPKYLAQVLRYNIKDNGLISAMPSLGMWIASIFSGLFSDWLFTHRNIRIITLRRWFTAVGNIFPGIFCVLAGYAGCNVNLAVFLLTMVLTTKGPFYCGVKVNYLDITTNFAGLVLALNNGLSAMSGFICPYIISWVAKDQTVGQWQLYFWISLFMSIVPTVVYWFMTGDQRRPWDYGEDETPPPPEGAKE